VCFCNTNPLPFSEPQAVKRIIKDCDSEALAEFIAEAELMAKIPSHTNVLHFVGLVSSEGSPALVTEFCAGSSLENAYTSTALDEATMWFVARGMAAGMAHLAASNVAHREYV
jgi:serine/threonine protein kinase